MNKLFILINLLLFFLFNNYSLADSKIIKNGYILQSKPYSPTEATLIVNNSNKIYICSIVAELTKCILSNSSNKN